MRANPRHNANLPSIGLTQIVIYGMMLSDNEPQQSWWLIGGCLLSPVSGGKEVVFELACRGRDGSRKVGDTYALHLDCYRSPRLRGLRNLRRRLHLER